MNERIKELTSQALKQARVNACEKNNTQNPQNNTIWNEFPEVFAELIIKECIDIAYKEGDNVAYLANYFGDKE